MNTRLTRNLAILTLGGLLVAGSAAAQNQNQGQKDLRDWQKGPPSIEEKLAKISDASSITNRPRRPRTRPSRTSPPPTSQRRLLCPRGWLPCSIPATGDT